MSDNYQGHDAQVQSRFLSSTDARDMPSTTLYWWTCSHCAARSDRVYLSIVTAVKRATAHDEMYYLPS